MTDENTIDRHGIWHALCCYLINEKRLGRNREYLKGKGREREHSKVAGFQQQDYF
ncbi:MAG: hypothetical protein JXO49_07790 [Deltaproteobacteria bacterium]|nr:hypothetical protein [Candidatus Anaeroferrophillus wilburensis]MBN2889229.1 hypothetical protein [Deltaproteobacteria bacterium]